jgi:hypothetical protein
MSLALFITKLRLCNKLSSFHSIYLSSVASVVSWSPVSRFCKALAGVVSPDVMETMLGYSGTRLLLRLSNTPKLLTVYGFTGMLETTKTLFIVDFTAGWSGKALC